MRFTLVEDVSTVKAGDVVFLKKDLPYKNDTTKWLVATNHRFLVLYADSENMLIFATTTQEKWLERKPFNYIKVHGKEKDFLVELNASGTLPIGYVEKVQEKISGEDYTRVFDAVLMRKPKTNLQLEKLSKKLKNHSFTP